MAKKKATTAVLNAGVGYYGLAEYIEEAKRREIKVLGPDVNRSYYQFEVEGVGERRCLTFGSPPACYLRGEVRHDGNGRAKIFYCSFLNPY